MQRMKGKKGFMAIKIDLEKSYGRINWDFFIDILKETGLREQIIDVISNCVSSASMHILWNGSNTNSFSPSRGLRKGDPPFSLSFCALY